MHSSRLLTIIALTAPTVALGDSPETLQWAWTREAKQQDAGFAGFSASRGAAFFASRHGGNWRCSSCHTDHPLASGRHVVTGKVIMPLAPAANPERFTDTRKVEKWFRRNCRDVLSRDCTPQEKGDVLAYLLELGSEERR